MVQERPSSRSSLLRLSEPTTEGDDDGEEFLNDWDEWSEHELGHGPKARWEEHFCDFNTGKVVTPASVAARNTTSGKPLGKPEIDHIATSIPCMPCVHSHQGHRGKLNEGGSMKFGKMFNAMVSRPVGRKEMMEDPEARASMRNQ